MKDEDDDKDDKIKASKDKNLCLYCMFEKAPDLEENATLYGKVFRKRRLSKSGELLKWEVKTKREDS